MIDNNTKEKILAAADIVDVVGEFVELKRSGSGYVGLCPFHDDSNPSLTVSPSRGTYKCFACGEGGDVISFLMRKEMMSYPEAIEWLAQRYGIAIQHPRQTREQWIEENEREGMFAVNELAKKYYAEVLANKPEGDIGREFFQRRGVSEDMIKSFHLGYAPQGGQLIEYVRNAGQSMKHLFASGNNITFKSGKTLHVKNGTGLIYQNENGRFNERYAGRIIFPWHNRSGKVIAFGARVPDARSNGVVKKYVNSYNSNIFEKGRELYGLYQAKRGICDADMVYVVEGYMDVISMHQYGITNVVANSGTAMTDAQVRLLHRYTSNVTLVYDSDDAGMKATLRSTCMLLEVGMNVYVISLPKGEDPDSFCHSHTPEEVKEHFSRNRQTFAEFMSDSMLKGVTDPVQQAEAIHAIMDCIRKINDNIKRELFIKHLTKVSGLDESLLRREIDK